MTQKKENPPAEAEQDERRAVEVNWRRYWIRAAVLTALFFILIAWMLYPARGNVAFLWAAGIALAVLGYFATSYYLLNR